MNAMQNVGFSADPDAAKMTEGKPSDVGIGSTLLERIVSDPDVHQGRPCTRKGHVWVSRVLDLLAMGVPMSEVAEECKLDIDDVRACLAYAAFTLRPGRYGSEAV